MRFLRGGNDFRGRIQLGIPILPLLTLAASPDRNRKVDDSTPGWNGLGETVGHPLFALSALEFMTI